MSANSQFSLDVTERHMLLHFAYQLSDCSQWLVATSIDQAGHDNAVRVWAMGDNSDEEQSSRATEIAQRLWAFITEIAKKADIEWRIVLARVGVMEDVELRGALLTKVRKST
jgi:mediator of RNA polymerase II transcription subunit 13